MLVADWPEVGTGAVVADEGEAVPVGQRMQVFPAFEVRRAEKEIRRQRRTAGSFTDLPTGKRIVVIPLPPDARIENPVRQALALLGHRDHRTTGHLGPIEQQRIARGGHHVPRLRPVVHGDDAVLLDQGGPREAAVLRIGIDAVRQVPPVDEIVTHGVAPMLARVLRRIRLVEEVPAPLPETEPVGVVQHGLRVDVVVDRPMPIASQPGSRAGQPFDHRVPVEGSLLLGKGLREAVVRHFGA